MTEKKHRVAKTEPGSIADELGIEPGDLLLAVNDSEIEDVLDYHYLIHDEHLVLLV